MGDGEKVTGEPAAKKMRKMASSVEPSNGRPRKPDSRKFVTAGGVEVNRVVKDMDPEHVGDEFVALASALDHKRGALFESAYDAPGRYSRWTMGFYDPPLALETHGLTFKVSALNERGKVVLAAFEAAVRSCEAVDASSLICDESLVSGRVRASDGKRFAEEERSKQPSVFSVVRSVIEQWGSDEDPQLGLLGAIGWDIAFQFESIELTHERDPAQRDVVLYLPDMMTVFDKQLNQGWRIEYEFTYAGKSTSGLKREGPSSPFKGNMNPSKRRDHEPGEYAKSVERAREEFRVGNLFEAVLSQTFYEPCSSKPSEILATLRERNPSPYLFCINLGEQEWLVGASPEMFVRVERGEDGLQVLTCPISGTIKRGENALEDAERVKEILANRKEESELTMCTDVDRNDKSRICKPGSVQVIGRRQIETYSTLLHTVDVVSGTLRDEFDALDAFLSTAWAVTVSGSPKLWAMQFVERNEKSARAWYGGAVGLIGFNGEMNTGMTLRTIRLKDGVAEIRAGATLLFDSKPEDEERETELKASAFRDAVLATNRGETAAKPVPELAKVGRDKRVVLIDHQDSFVHTLANYVRQTGAEVSTVRFGIPREDLVAMRPDLVIMSPGPGKPSDFKCSDTLAMLIDLKIPVFGVCLGLQSMVEHFGATLDILPYPMHGKPSKIRTVGTSKWRIFEGLKHEFTVARYHSLFGERTSIEACDSLNIIAELDDGTVMAIEHDTLPMAAVQFHPESILTRSADGLGILSNALSNLKY